MATVPGIESVITRHAEEAAFLWLQRDAAVVRPQYVLGNLAERDLRVEAHLDGLRIAGQAGWDACREELRWEGAGEIFPAAVLAFEGGDSSRIKSVLDTVGESYEPSRGLVSALGWMSYDRASDPIERFLAAEESLPRRLGIAACAIHRRDPGQRLVAALDDADLLLKARALRAVGELGRVDLLTAARRSIAAEDEGCRVAAAWSVALISGERAAVEVLKHIVEAGGPGRDRALQTAPRRMEIRAAGEWIDRMAQEDRLCRSAVVGAGVVGTAESVPWLIDRMQVPALARVAGEALTMITGLKLDSSPFEGEWPEGFHAGPTDDPEDENVEMDPDENLPWPDREKIADWWRKNQDRFEPATRCLLGRPMTVDWLNDVLRNGYQRQRAAAALELAIRQPGTPLFEVRAPGWRQQELLARNCTQQP